MPRASRPAGHPAHQVRQFTITVRNAAGKTRKLHARAQTRDDALLRAGLGLAQAAGAAGQQWIVTGVEDPGPYVWFPVEEGPR